MNWCCGVPHCEGEGSRDKTLENIGAGLFFIWIGVAWLAGLGFGAGLLGVGVLLLGMQAVRRILHEPVHGFSIWLGLALAVFGVWEILAIETSLVPLLLIVGGIALLFWRVRPQPRPHDPGPAAFH